MKRSIRIALTLFILLLTAFPLVAQGDVNPDDGIDVNEARIVALTQYPDNFLVPKLPTPQEQDPRHPGGDRH